MKYIKKMLYQIKTFIVTLKFSILFIFISLFIVACTVLITINYISSSNDIIYIENQSMKQTTEFLHHLFINEINAAERDAKLTASLMKRNVINPDDLEEIMNHFYILAEKFNLSQSISWGDVNGNYVKAEYEDDDSISTSFIKKNAAQPVELLIKRDPKGNIIKYNKSTPTHHDPRTMEWYLKAALEGKSVWTDVYLDIPKKYPVISLATPVYDKNNKLRGVIGLDMPLDWISWYINNLKISANGIMFIIQSDGQLIAYPEYDKTLNQYQQLNRANMPYKWLAEGFNIFKQTKNKFFSFSYNSDKYLASFHPIPEFQRQGWIIGIIIPEQDIISTIYTSRTNNIIISLLTLFVGILLFSRLVNNIVNPVKLLINETNKIKEFDLDDEVIVHSRIKEIILLSNAIATMKIGLSTFKHYVPSALVKQLMKKGEAAKLGGTKKTVAAFFSDIRNFTQITHSSDPDVLVMQLNEYFEAATSIITDEGGTIDKYIGDSIMAFWGAPEDFQNPCHHAARAALKIIDKISILNQQWTKEGKFPFYTRIGIHMGDAIVGNLGSTERINYTAIGETINIASRIEGVNKQFDTQILVSETVYTAIKNQFILNAIGLVKLKGLREKIYVYTLIDYHDQNNYAYSTDIAMEYDELS